MRYVTLTNALIQDKALQYSSKMVAYALAVARRKDGTTRQTIAQLCAMTGLCRATVQQGLRELEEAGYLTRQRGRIGSLLLWPARFVTRPATSSCGLPDSLLLCCRWIFWATP